MDTPVEIGIALDQVVPLKVNTSPAASPAAQNPALGHEIAVIAEVLTGAGVDHDRGAAPGEDTAPAPGALAIWNPNAVAIATTPETVTSTTRIRRRDETRFMKNLTFTRTGCPDS